MLATVAGIFMANLSGMSGGGIMVPICIGLYRFDAKNAIALSNFSICLGSVIRFLLNAHKPHPLKNGKGLLVDHNLAVLMLPMIISGVSVGVICNIMFPEMIICASYALFQVYLLYGLFNKFIDMRKIEDT